MGRRFVRFTNTEVPRFSGNTCWDQHRQVFDTIVKSNVWNDDTAALRLLAHLEGDALSVALLVPETKRATQSELVGALDDHYRSPGRLADYRRKFAGMSHAEQCRSGDEPPESVGLLPTDRDMSTAEPEAIVVGAVSTGAPWFLTGWAEGWNL